MVLATACSGVHIGEKHTSDVMLAGKRVVVVEMTVPADSLAVFGVRHGHVACHDLVVLLGDAYDDILRIVVTPCRNEHCVLVVVGKAVVGGIVDGEQCLERQALHEVAHVIDDTGIELELTAHVCCLSAEVAVCNGVGLRGLRTSGEVLSVEQVKRLVEEGKCLRGIGIHHVDGNQRGGVLREVRTAVFASIDPVAILQLFTCSLMPEFTLVLVGIVERGAGVGKALDHLVDHEVHITTYTETVGVVLLGITEVEEILHTVVVDVRVEVGTLTTTLNLQCSFQTVVGLADILV